MPVGKGQGKSALRNALAPGLLPHPCRLALHPGTAREGRAWSKIRIPAKRGGAGSDGEVCKSGLREWAQQHQCAGNERQVSSETQTKPRCPTWHCFQPRVWQVFEAKQWHYTCPFEGQNAEVSFQLSLFCNIDKAPERLLQWACPPRGGCRGDSGPTGLCCKATWSTHSQCVCSGSCRGLHRFWKKATTAEICHLNLISCCLWWCSPGS